MSDGWVEPEEATKLLHCFTTIGNENVHISELGWLFEKLTKYTNCRLPLVIAGPMQLRINPHMKELRFIQLIIQEASRHWTAMQELLC